MDIDGGSDNSFAVPGIFQLTGFTWGAAAFRYTSASATAPGLAHRQIIIWGGNGGAVTGTVQGPETG